MSKKAQHFLLNYFKLKDKKYHIVIAYLILFVCLISIYTSCAGENNKKLPENIRFSIFGNTLPETPYTAMGIKIETAIIKINDDNPLFAVHIGDIVCGGGRWRGIKKNDIEKQYDNFYSIAKNLKPMLYTVIGEMDFFNQSPEIYNIYTKKKDYYSFNYGNIHFIVLNTADVSPGEIGKVQIEWLTEDLDLYKNREAIFIFTHHPLFFPKREITDQTDVVKDYITLHKLFLKYPVRAVFSGHLPVYYKEEIDNITYIITGCGDYDKKYNYSKAYQYYIIDYSFGTINILAKRL